MVGGFLFSSFGAVRLVGDFDSLLRPPRLDMADADRDCGAELPVSADCRRLLTGSLEVGESFRNVNRVAEFGLEE